METFHTKINSLKQFYCTSCCEMWPNTKQECNTCKKNKNSHTSQNSMNPNLGLLPLEIKKHFEELSMVKLIN